MLWQVEPSSATPLFEQLAAQIRRAVASGALRQGERLPAAREVAASLEVNVHTVLRAYQLVRDEGLVELRRGRGAVVVGPADTARLTALARELRTEATRLGLTTTDLVALLTKEDPR